MRIKPCQPKPSTLSHALACRVSSTVAEAGPRYLREIKLGGLSTKILRFAGGHRQTAVRVDVDLADGAFGGLAELLFGARYGILQRTAVRVDDLSRTPAELVDDPCSTMGEARKPSDSLTRISLTQFRQNEDALGVAGAIVRA